jgi:hypothetical protein
VEIVTAFAGAVLSLVVLGIALYAVILATKLFRYWRLTRFAERARRRQELSDARIRDSLQAAGFQESEIEDALRDSGSAGPPTTRE